MFIALWKLTLLICQCTSVIAISFYSWHYVPVHLFCTMHSRCVHWFIDIWFQCHYLCRVCLRVSMYWTCWSLLYHVCVILYWMYVSQCDNCSKKDYWGVFSVFSSFGTWTLPLDSVTYLYSAELLQNVFNKLMS